MTSEKKMDDTKSDACFYHLSIMLQRIEDEKEGFIREMINGVESDRNSTPDNIADKSHIDQVFMHGLKILNRCEKSEKKFLSKLLSPNFLSFCVCKLKTEVFTKCPG